MPEQRPCRDLRREHRLGGRQMTPPRDGLVQGRKKHGIVVQRERRPELPRGFRGQRVTQGAGVTGGGRVCLREASGEIEKSAAGFGGQIFFVGIQIRGGACKLA